MGKNAQLRVNNLTKKYEEGRTTAVRDVSFEITQGEIGVLLGPSGCGKTTTLRCIAGVETVDSGEILINGERVSSADIHVSPENRHLGMVYQNYAIWPHKTVYENVVFPLKYASTPEDEYRDRVAEILEIVEIKHLIDVPATDLSGGQQQRTALARAVVHDPDLLLLDEPLSNLDAQLRTTMRNEIQRLQYELGITIVYVTHDQEEAFYLADDVMVLNNAELMESGGPKDLYNTPHTTFTRSFVGRWNNFTGKIENGHLITPFGKTRDNPSYHSDDDIFTCFIRPTDIEIGDGDSSNRIISQGIVIAEGILGELYEFTLDVNGEELTIQSTEYFEFDRGEEITVTMDPADFQFYSGDGR